MKKYEWVSASPNRATCVEVMDDGFGVRVRDSKDPNGTILAFTYSEWDAFLAGVKAREFDPRVG